MITANEKWLSNFRTKMRNCNQTFLHTLTFVRFIVMPDNIEQIASNPSRYWKRSCDV